MQELDMDGQPLQALIRATAKDGPFAINMCDASFANFLLLFYFCLVFRSFFKGDCRWQWYGRQMLGCWHSNHHG